MKAFSEKYLKLTKDFKFNTIFGYQTEDAKVALFGQYKHTPYGTDGFSHNCINDFYTYLENKAKTGLPTTIIIEGDRLFQCKQITQLHKFPLQIILYVLTISAGVYKLRMTQRDTQRGKPYTSHWLQSKETVLTKIQDKAKSDNWKLFSRSIDTNMDIDTLFSEWKDKIENT